MKEEKQQDLKKNKMALKEDPNEKLRERIKSLEAENRGLKKLLEAYQCLMDNSVILPEYTEYEIKKMVEEQKIIF